MCVYKDGMEELRQAINDEKQIDSELLSDINILLRTKDKIIPKIDEDYDEMICNRFKLNDLSNKLSPNNFDYEGLTELDCNLLGLKFNYNNINTDWMQLADDIEINTPNLLDKIDQTSLEGQNSREHYVDKKYKIYVPKNIKPGYVLAAKLYNITKPLSFKSIANWASTWIPPVDIFDNVETTEIIVSYRNKFAKVGMAYIYGDIDFVLNEDRNISQEVLVGTFNWKTQLNSTIQNAFTKEYYIAMSEYIYNKSIPEIRNCLINTPGLSNSTVKIDSMIAETSKYLSLGLYNDLSNTSKQFKDIPGMGLLNDLNTAGRVSILNMVFKLVPTNVASELSIIYFLARVITIWVTNTVSMNIIAEIKKALQGKISQNLEQTVYSALYNLDLGQKLAADSIDILERKLFTIINFDTINKIGFGVDRFKFGK